MAMETHKRVAGSFRDPSGFMFWHDQRLFRQVNRAYQPHYERLMSAGLYERLVQKGLLVAHREADVPAPLPELAYRIVEPELIPCISYPYEWCFSQLKDAALLTLAIQKEALEQGMTLMDASAYNVQFLRGRPVWIDTLSFEIYTEGAPWTAYQQFCQHFLAPLALMATCDVRLGQLSRLHIDGVPLDLASRILPARSRLDFGLLSHIHLQAAAQNRYAGQELAPQISEAKVSRMALRGLIDSLETTLRKLTWKPGGSEWVDYYTDTNYSPAAMEAKVSLVAGYLQAARPQRVLDLGANTGLFSRLAAKMGVLTLSADIDPGAVERNYLEVRRTQEPNLLPLLLDLTNPSPALGWENRERDDFFRRQGADTVLALALVHHLAIANNVPLPDLAGFFSRLGRCLIVEFIPKEDSQVQRLLRYRRDIFSDYHAAGFEAAFAPYFTLREKQVIPGTQRILYRYER